jgi:epoxide hydrolase-like predicted phosphatase
VDASDLNDHSAAFAALIVDFGGVLTNPLQESLEAFASSIGIELQDLVRVMLPIYTGQADPMVEGFETGQIDDAEFDLGLARRLAETTGKKVEAEGLVGRIFAGTHLEPMMLDLLAAARGSGMKTALLSNSWGMSGYPKELLDDLFDLVIISGEVGLRKPDAAIFQLTLERLNVPATKCIFVDDHPGHLEPAQKRGMTTILHVSPDQTVTRVRELTGLSLEMTPGDSTRSSGSGKGETV